MWCSLLCAGVDARTVNRNREIGNRRYRRRAQAKEESVVAGFHGLQQALSIAQMLERPSTDRLVMWSDFRPRLVLDDGAEGSGCIWVGIWAGGFSRPSRRSS